MTASPTVGRAGSGALDLADRVLLVASYWPTNLTMRQIGPLFGVSHSAAYRVIDTRAPLLALAPVRKRPVEQIAIAQTLRRNGRNPYRSVELLGLD